MPFTARFLSLVFFLMITVFSFAQELTQTIRGKITDKANKMPMPGATVILLGSDSVIGTTTNTDGYYRLEKVKVGRAGIQISYMGYNTVVLNNINLTSGKEMILDVEMEEMVITGKTVEIVADADKSKTINEMTTVSARTFSVDESRRYAGSMNDVSRMAGNFAGVQSANDSRNDIIIRGNSPTGVLYRLEGLDIPNPNHFAFLGNTGGPVSILNNNVLANSDFMTGAFPAEYGNALAGVFDLRMRNGNNEKREFVGQVGFNGAELLAEGPFSKKHKASYLLSYRYSTLAMFKYLGMSFGTFSVPFYQDLSVKINIPHKKGVTGFLGVGGLSTISMLDSEIDTANNIYGRYGEDIVFGSDVGAAGIFHTQILSPKSYLKIVTGINGFRNTIISDSLSTADRSPFPSYRNNSKTGKYTANATFNHKISAKNQYKTGVQYDLMFFNLSDSSYRAEYGRFITLSDYKGDAALIRSFFQWQYKPVNELVFNAGIYAQHFFLSNSSSLEPRLGIKYQISNIQSLNFGYGLHSQIQPIPVYFEKVFLPDNSYVTPNKKASSTRSHHFIVGYDRNLSETIRVKAETYFQYLLNAPVDVRTNSFSMLNEGAGYGLSFPDTLVNSGTGRNYGIELTLEKFLSNGFYFLVTSSLFDSKYRGSDGVMRNTAFNGNYVANTLAGKEFVLPEKQKSNKKYKQYSISADLRFVYMRGRPFTPVDFERSKMAATTIYRDDLAFSNRNPDYLRFDLKAGVKRNGEKTTQEWGIYLQNATNRKNISQVTYNPKTQQMETSYQLGILPVFQYRIEF